MSATRCANICANMIHFVSFQNVHPTLCDINVLWILASISHITVLQQNVGKNMLTVCSVMATMYINAFICIGKLLPVIIMGHRVSPLLVCRYIYPSLRLSICLSLCMDQMSIIMYGPLSCAYRRKWYNQFCKYHIVVH